MWVMGMALEEDERTAARERDERTMARDVEEMQQDVAQDRAGDLQGDAAHMECIPSAIVLEMEESADV